MEQLEYIDISPEISSKIGVWPGDVGFKRIISASFKAGENLLLSSIQTSLHLGAHADAPNHYHREGGGISERDLSYYMGECQVITVAVKAGERIFKEHIMSIEINTPRVLFKTSSFPSPNQWKSDFVALSAELIGHLASIGVRLVGIDTPSIDPQECKNLEAHSEVFKNNMAILEGLVLEHVKDGKYFLVALPLKIKDADASPVRAILIKK